ncbi:hypothetical protein [Pasteurella atlantica]|uniref:hypothetical protein n=1 Tax=Pasteurellaceae TaxID=712 RepID=UPI00276D8D79|nr:hypothetical protein [Pasteurella atlantica]MDP8099283.1 hypothetical protein [Pasteurella atlantica]MDP8100339.1 hypothetical protein [Pasteurella atlantica]MDP8106158.1 hypothetical protein [Pasteurella atlantica]MDP8115883.1 hypothetical protein [Pasteurella atlantica]
MNNKKISFNKEDGSISDQLISKLYYSKDIKEDSFIEIINHYGEEVSDNELLELEKTILNYYFDEQHDNSNIKNNIDALSNFKFIDNNNALSIALRIKNYFAKTEFFQNAYDKKYTKLIKSVENKAEELDKKSKELDKNLKETEQKALEKLSIFIAIFTLIAGNISVLYKTTDFSPLILISILFIINGTLILSIQTLFKVIGSKFSVCYFLIPIGLNLLGIFLLIYPEIIQAVINKLI